MRMTMTRNAIAGFAAVLAALAFAAPHEAWAEDERQSPAFYCAVAYMQALTSERAPEIIADHEQIALQNRHEILVETHDDFDFDDVRHAAVTQPNLVFQKVTVEELLDSGDPAREGMAIDLLATCDRRYGFTPVAARKGIDHVQCTAHYYLLGALRHDLQGETTPRVQWTSQTHIHVTPGASMEDVRRDVPALARARGMRIQGGEDSFEALIADVHACDAQYGLEPINP